MTKTDAEGTAYLFFKIKVKPFFMIAIFVALFPFARMSYAGMDINLIKQLLHKENPVVVVLGAAEGDDTKRFLNEFSGIRIWSFEPDPRSISLFKKAIHDSRSVLVEAAVSDKDGKAMLNLSAGWPSEDNPLHEQWRLSSSIKESVSNTKEHPWLVFKDKTEVKTVRLDTWIKQNNITSIDFIWSDIQGAEREMLNGAVQTLKICKYLLTECGETQTYLGALTRQETIALLTKHHFKLVPRHSSSRDLLFRNTDERAGPRSKG